MNVLISGASGLVGTHLTQALLAQGDSVVGLSRSGRTPTPGTRSIAWAPREGKLDLGELEAGQFDAVVNLAGEGIAEGRWTDAKKERILRSRVEGTTLLSQSLAKLERKPAVLVSASAVGYYGDRGDQVLDEEAGPGEGFLPDVCVAWEQATHAAEQAGIRVVHLRIGVVLAKEGGALGKMLLPFRLGLGGKLGSGQQYFSWIGLEDLVAAIRHCLATDDLRGPVNGAAPEPVTNAAFTKALGQVLGRPTILPVPSFGARLALGQMADDLLLASTRMTPRRLLETGFAFRHREVRECLEAILKDR